MTQVGQDTLGTRSTLNRFTRTGHARVATRQRHDPGRTRYTVGGKEFAYYSLAKAAAKFGDISRLPFSMKVLLENLLRFEDGGFTVSTR
jgi:aconitate hydratase